MNNKGGKENGHGGGGQADVKQTGEEEEDNFRPASAGTGSEIMVHLGNDLSICEVALLP